MRPKLSFLSIILNPKDKHNTSAEKYKLKPGVAASCPGDVSVQQAPGRPVKAMLQNTENSLRKYDFSLQESCAL